MSSRPPQILVFILAVLLTFIVLDHESRAQSFQTVSPDELKMLAEPKAPGAPAIILYRQVDRDDNGHTSHEDHYLRIKILTEEGRKYGDVEIPFNKAYQDVVNIHARSIRPDGTVNEFKGQILENTITKVQGVKYLAKVFTLPEVQVGSIIEYSYTVDLSEHELFDSHWILSDSLFTRSARFSLKPYQSRTAPMIVRYIWQGLPDGVKPVESSDHVVRLEVHDLPAFQIEDRMPPQNELKARVDFIYEDEFLETDPDQYWHHVDKKYNDELEKFINRPKVMQEALAQILSPGDSPDVKLHKIYARVQEIRNKSYELRKSEQELKRSKEKPDENVEDVWKRGYGNHRQLTWLYLALVRTAGFDACGVLASSRRDYFFNSKSMERRKLNTGVVLVHMDGKDLYFDPGGEFTPFGMLTWSETGTTGLCLNKDGGAWVKTSLPSSSDSRIQHKARLKLTEDGALEGTLTITYTGLEAMYHRLDVRNADEEARKTFLDRRAKSQIPVPMEVKLTNQPDWESSDAPLVAEFKVKIPAWAAEAGKRKLIPATLFSGSEKHLFEHAERVHPVYMTYPYQQDDDVTIELPSGWKVESLPNPKSQPTKVVSYEMKVEQDGNTLHLTRTLDRNFLLLDQKSYSFLRNFFQGVRSGDEQQIVIQPSNPSAGE